MKEEKNIRSDPPAMSDETDASEGEEGGAVEQCGNGAAREKKG